MATLTCALNDEQFYNYTHRRKISGTLTLTSLETFDSFELYLNNDKLPSPNVSVIGNVISFATELFIQFGLNNFKLITKYIENNVTKQITKETTYNLDYLEDEKEKEYLLTNFIGNDYEKTQLIVGSSKLSYKDNNANEVGVPKELNINVDVPSNFFQLLGDEAKYYRLDKNDLPKIYSGIISRPLFVTFENVKKRYDGNDNATDLLLDLIGETFNNTWQYKFKKNHNFVDINNDQYDYSPVGFLEGIGETLINKTIIYKANDEIHLDDEIEIFNNAVDFNDFEINIDGVIGKYNIEQDKFIFINPGSNSEKFVIYDLINTIFDKIYLIQQDLTKEIEITNEIEEVTETIIQIVESKFYIKFILNDEDTPYKVADSVIIKYKYKNNNENIQIYAKSDVNYVSLDFNSAKFDTRNVTSTLQSILINNLQFTKGINLEDRSNNYQIAGYSFSGIIEPRPVKVGVKCLPKIYDGNNIAPIQIITSNVDLAYDCGITKLSNDELSGKISGDDLYITCFDNSNLKDNNDHFDLQIGNSYCIYKTTDVGESKIIDKFDTFLEGKDKNNYYISDKYIDTSEANVFPREITLTIDKVIVNSNTSEFILVYHFNNDIENDHLSIDYSTINLYGGTRYNNDNENVNMEIFSTFLDYESLYQTEWIESTDTNDNNVYPVLVGDMKTLWYDDEKRVAKNRIAVRKILVSNINNELIKFSDELGYAFYESKNKEYKLYNGCKLKITGVNLDTSNSKVDNYIFNQHEYDDIPIEII